MGILLGRIRLSGAQNVIRQHILKGTYSAQMHTSQDHSTNQRKPLFGDTSMIVLIDKIV